MFYQLTSAIVELSCRTRFPCLPSLSVDQREDQNIERGREIGECHNSRGVLHVSRCRASNYRCRTYNKTDEFVNRNSQFHIINIYRTG